jgi:hypothetical protein
MMPYPLTTIRSLIDREVLDSNAPAFEKDLAQGLTLQVSVLRCGRSASGASLDGRVNTGEGFCGHGLGSRIRGLFFTEEVSLTGRWTGFGLDASEVGYSSYYEPNTYDVFVDNANLDPCFGRELQLSARSFLTI